MRRPILVLVNPISGGKPAAPGMAVDRPDPEAMQAALRDSGIDVELHVLAEHDDPGALSAAAAERGRDVVVAGGDGTVRPAAVALVGTASTLGIVPLGSWNNIARGCGIPQDPGAALDVITAGGTHDVDVGLAWHPTTEAGDEPVPADAIAFFEAAGVGLDAAGFGAAKAGERHGTWSALRIGWRALRRRRTAMRLEADGRALRTAAPAVAICNGPYYGMGFAIAPDADPTDGMLDVVVFSGMSRLDVVRHYLAVARGRPRREPGVRYLPARRIRVEGLAALPAHADGESLGVTPVAFAIKPSALRMFATTSRARHEEGPGPRPGPS